MAVFPDSTPMTEISRPVIEAEIELLIDLLDQLDDPDAEPEDDDEPWLGAPDARTGSWSGLYSEGNDDREEDTADDESTDDDEPSIGAPNFMTGCWLGLKLGHNGDRELDDCDLEDGHDEEPELGWTALQAKTGKFYWGMNWLAEDSEPSLASTNSLNQTYWWMGRGGDLEDEHDGREECCEDEGAQCDDEGAIEYEGDPDEDKEHWYEGFPCYHGPCSPITTMVGQPGSETLVKA